MKIFNKFNINAFLVIVLSLALGSCGDDDANLETGVLEANFVTTVDARTISFINISENATDYLWDFGNGTTSSLVDPEVVFEDGTFTVVLTAFDDKGNSDTQQATFTIENIFDGGLLTNGDFENGSEAWIQGVDDNNPAPIVTDANNTFYQVNITNPNPSQTFFS